MAGVELAAGAQRGSGPFAVVGLTAESGGFVYSADTYADELPYWNTDYGKPLLMVPYTLEQAFLATLNDLGMGELAGLDCVEYPCVVGIRLDDPQTDRTSFKSFQPVLDGLKEHGYEGHSMATSSFVNTGDDELLSLVIAPADKVWDRTRTKFRVRRLLDEMKQEAP